MKDLRLKQLADGKIGVFTRLQGEKGGKGRIGICDDDKELCSGLEEQIYYIAKELPVKVDVGVWYIGESILKDLGNGMQLDLIFLDIELAHKNGISVGRFIRGEMEDIQTHIVYISSKQSYAMQLFKIQPLDFLIKPVSKEQLKEVLEQPGQSGRRGCQGNFDAA